MLVTVLQTARLSHSEILGSRVICTYPKLIAAYHVLHRLREPRHPPYALSYFLYDCICYQFNWQRISSSYFQLYSNKVKSHLAIWFTLVWTKVHYLQFCLCQYVKDLFALKAWWRLWSWTILSSRPIYYIRCKPYNFRSPCLLYLIKQMVRTRREANFYQIPISS